MWMPSSANVTTGLEANSKRKNTFAYVCLIPIIVFCSSVILPCLFFLIISVPSGLFMLFIKKIIIQRNFTSCTLIAARILSDPSHRLSSRLSKFKSLRQIVCPDASVNPNAHCF